MNRSKTVILLLVITIAAMLGTWYVTAYATSNSGNSTMLRLKKQGLGFRFGGRMQSRRGRYGFVEVSAEFNQTMINIAESDLDVQNILAEGYSISAVRPIIKSVVQADGTIVRKATSAIVILIKDTTGKASVYVDVTAGKVTKIVILTRTVIEKN